MLLRLPHFPVEALVFRHWNDLDDWRGRPRPGRRRGRVVVAESGLQRVADGVGILRRPPWRLLRLLLYHILHGVWRQHVEGRDVFRRVLMVRNRVEVVAHRPRVALQRAGPELFVAHVGNHGPGDDVDVVVLECHVGVVVSGIGVGVVSIGRVLVMIASIFVARGHTVGSRLLFEVITFGRAWRPDHACIGQPLNTSSEVVFPLSDTVLLVNDSGTRADVEHQQHYADYHNN